MTKDDVDLLKHCLSYGRYFKCIPVDWDYKSGRVIVKSRRQQIFVYFSILLNFLAMLCRIYSVSLHPSSIVACVEAATGAVLYTVNFLIRLDVPVDVKVVQMVNLIICETSIGKSLNI